MAIAFIFCLFLARFFYVQVIWKDDLNARALDQWTREIPIAAGRGNIYDANGELLAGNTPAYTVYARANAVADAEGEAETLSAALGLSYEEALEKLTDGSRSEIVLVKRTDKTAVQSIEGLDLAGVYYSRDDARFYPHGALACQVLGFTSYDGAGASGLEQFYNGYLAGRRGEILFETDLVGVDLEGATAAYIPGTDGMDVTLTLDYRIQTIAEEVMARAYETYSAKAARAIVMDVTDFSVLAMVNLPSYDLNDIPRNDLAALNALSRNGLVSDVYEPGSTFKIVTAAANIEEYLRGNAAAYAPNRIFSSARTRTVDGTTIRCWSDHANGKHSNQTLAEALNNSCNPCFVDLALALGKETFYDYLDAFGFGRATGLDFSGEAIGMLRKYAPRLRFCPHRIRTVHRRYAASACVRLRRGGQRRLLLCAAAGCKDHLRRRSSACRDLAHAGKADGERGGVRTPHLHARGGRAGRQRKKGLHRGVPRGGQDGYGAKIRKRAYRAGEICFVVCRMLSREQPEISCARHCGRTAGSILRKYRCRAVREGDF